jgi:hypothetical protein
VENDITDEYGLGKGVEGGLIEGDIALSLNFISGCKKISSFLFNRGALPG